MRVVFRFEQVMCAHALARGNLISHEAICTAKGHVLLQVNHSPFGPVHGQLSRVTHTGDHALLKGIEQGFQVVRYHSLAICNKDGTPSIFPSHLEKIAWTDDGVLMAIGHTQLPLWGVQFHPESICTQGGGTLLANFHNMSLAHHRAASTLPHSLPADVEDCHAASRRGNPEQDELAWTGSMKDFYVPHECENKTTSLSALFRKIDADVEPETIYNHLYRYGIRVNCAACRHVPPLWFLTQAEVCFAAPHPAEPTIDPFGSTQRECRRRQGGSVSWGDRRGRCLTASHIELTNRK